MKLQNFQQRNLLLYNPWKWLLNEFASDYGVSDAYTKLRLSSFFFKMHLRICYLLRVNNRFRNMFTGTSGTSWKLLPQKLIA